MIDVAAFLQELEEQPPQTYVELCRGLSVCLKEGGQPVVRLHYSALPSRDPDTPEGNRWLKEQRAKYSAQSSWDREQEIIDAAGGGEMLLAPTLSQFKNAIIIQDEDWLPDPGWECVEGFDHGKTNATCLEKAYLDFDGNIYMAGEYYNWRREASPGRAAWANEVHQNAPYLMELHNIKKPRWSMADPSIFADKELQKDGTYTNAAQIYNEHGVTWLRKYEDERDDTTFIARIMEHWAQLAPRELEDGTVVHRLPTLFIVCRPHLDRGQRMPGLHPFDCPNLLWELRRARTHKLTDRQLLTRNPTERVVDKDNHARDAFKYLLMLLPRPSNKPLQMRYEEEKKTIEKKLGQHLTPFSEAMFQQRFLEIQKKGKSSSHSMIRRGRMMR